jgi:hypothetical protein
MTRILDRLLKKRLNSSLNRIQAKLSWGLPIDFPQGLNDKEKDMYSYCMRTVQMEVYNAIEDLKSK